MCLKKEQFSIQSDVKICGEKGKISVMKEIRDLAEKNDYFGEVSYESMTTGMNSKALTLLILMHAKRNGVIKSRGLAT